MQWKQASAAYYFAAINSAMQEKLLLDQKIQKIAHAMLDWYY